MSNATQEVFRYGLESAHLQFAEELIQDVREEEKKENLLAAFYYWECAIKYFRWVEHQCLHEKQKYDQDDLHVHATMLHALIAVGKLLESSFSSNPSTTLPVSHDVIAAMNTELQHSLEEWHAQTDQDQLSQLRSRIFA